MLKSADSIPRFARKRASNDPTFDIPSGSRFQDLAPYGCPPMCTECTRGSKTRNTVRWSILKEFMYMKWIIKNVFYYLKNVISNMINDFFVFLKSHGLWDPHSSNILLHLFLYVCLSKCLVHSFSQFTPKVSFVAYVAYAFGLILFHLKQQLLHQVL